MRSSDVVPSSLQANFIKDEIEFTPISRLAATPAARKWSATTTAATDIIYRQRYDYNCCPLCPANNSTEELLSGELLNQGPLITNLNDVSISRAKKTRAARRCSICTDSRGIHQNLICQMDQKTFSLCLTFFYVYNTFLKVLSREVFYIF